MDRQAPTPAANRRAPLAVGAMCLASATAASTAFAHARGGTALRGRLTNPAQLQSQQETQGAAFGSSRPGIATPALVAAPLALATVATVARRSARGQRHQKRQSRRVWRKATAVQISEQQAKIAEMDFNDLESYPLGELDELYIDALWNYYREGKSLLDDAQYAKLKQTLYKLGSNFPTLRKDEVAFIEASIAFYRGEPVVSDAEYDNLKSRAVNLDKRKDVVAFLLYERGEKFLDDAQYQAMKDEYEKLGVTAVDLEKCTLAQMEEMYVDALWAYYHDGVQLLSDTQYNKLRFELQCEGSGFPWLNKDEIDFVKATMSYYRGDPLLSDDEWADLKQRVLAVGTARSDVTAFLLYSKGKEMLDAETFNKMRDSMARMGVTVQKAGTRALEQTLNVSNPNLTNDVGQVLVMVSALAAAPTILCTAAVWAIGLFLDYEFVPQPEWGAVLEQEFLPLFGAGLVLGMILTYNLLVFLDLQSPRILKGCCPSCNADIKMFSGGAAPVEQVEYSCKECGCKMVFNTKMKRIQAAGMGARIEPEVEEKGFDFRSAWNSLKKSLGN